MREHQRILAGHNDGGNGAKGPVRHADVILR
jgi:hypothetical protein